VNEETHKQICLRYTFFSFGPEILMVYPTTLNYIAISFAAGLKPLYFGWIYISVGYEVDLFHSRVCSVKEYNVEPSDSFLCIYITLVNKVFPLHLIYIHNFPASILPISCFLQRIE
jgi:hypothetical protein